MKSILSVYLSAPAPSADMMKDLASRIAGAKILSPNGTKNIVHVRSTWFLDSSGYLGTDPDSLQERAIRDFHEVKTSDYVLSFPGPGSRGGRASEVALGLSYHKKVMIFGERESIFDFYPTIELFGRDPHLDLDTRGLARIVLDAISKSIENAEEESPF
jgi:hypothetical protein